MGTVIRRIGEIIYAKSEHLELCVEIYFSFLFTTPRVVSFGGYTKSRPFNLVALPNKVKYPHRG